MLPICNVWALKIFHVVRLFFRIFFVVRFFTPSVDCLGISVPPFTFLKREREICAREFRLWWNRQQSRELLCDNRTTGFNCCGCSLWWSHLTWNSGVLRRPYSDAILHLFPTEFSWETCPEVRISCRAHQQTSGPLRRWRLSHSFSNSEGPRPSSRLWRATIEL